MLKFLTMLAFQPTFVVRPSFPAYRPALSQAIPAANGGNDTANKIRNWSVIVATVAGAALSVWYMSPDKPMWENVLLVLTAAALGGIAGVTFLDL